MDLMSFADSLAGAPDLIGSPSLVDASASSGDPTGTGQALSQTTFATTLANNAETAPTASPQHRGFWGQILHDTGIDTVAQYLAKPLQEVQHDYRYLRDVYAKHGFFAGLGETVATVGAGIVGTAVGGPAAGALAAEGTLYGLSNTLYDDSRKRTEDPNYMLNGHLVSPGRDLASLFGLDVTSHGGHGSGAGQWVSGAADAGFDFTADPLMKLGALAKSAKVGDLAEHTAQAAAGDVGAVGSFLNKFAPGRAVMDATQNRMASVNDLVQQYAPGTRMIDGAQVNALKDAPIAGVGYRRALDDIASKSSPTDIMKAYPAQKGLVDRLATADTPDAVNQVFVDAMNENALNRRVMTNELPTRTLMRPALEAARTALGDAISVDFADENSVRKALLMPTLSNIQGAVSRKIRTMTNNVPYGVNDKTMEISGTNFDVTSANAAQTVLDVASTGMSRTLAKDMTDSFIAAPTIGAKKAIYAEILVENAKAAGINQVRDPLTGAWDSEYMQHITDTTRQWVHGDGAETSYGVGHVAGDDVNNVEWKDLEGTTVTDRAALHPWQANTMASIPDYKALRNALADQSNPIVRGMAKTDEWVRSHYTDPVFKPFALLSAGFGMRVGFSEVTGAVMRNGLLPYLRARTAVAASRMEYNLTGNAGDDITSLEAGVAAGDEATHVAAAATRLMGGVGQVIRAPQQDIDLALHMTIDGKGQFTTNAANSGHNSLYSPEGPVQKASDAAWYLPGHDKRLGSRFTDDYRKFSRDDSNYTGYWVKQLNNAAYDPSSKLIAGDLTDAIRGGATQEDAAALATKNEISRINGVDPATGKAFVKDPYAAERQVLLRYDKQDPATFGTQRVDSVRNLFTGADGTFHHDLADQIAEGKGIPHEGVLDKIESDQRPTWLPGATELPNIGPGALQRVVDKGFKVMVQPFVQNLSRDPLFYLATKNNMKSLQGAVDQGLMTYDEAVTFAKRQASLDMLPQIHNTYLRSQASVMASNFLPFFFAQEQAMRRIGLVISKNPSAVRGYQLEAQGLNDPGFVNTDSNGNRTMVIPGAGLFGNALTQGLGRMGVPVQFGLPLSFNGSLSSLDTVLPTMKAPGISPMLAVGMNTLEQFAPSMASLIKATEGPAGYNKSLRDELIPNSFLRNAVNALVPDKSSKMWANSQAAAIAAAAAHGELPSETATAQEKQAFLDRMSNNSRSNFFAKAVLGLFSPVSPQPVPEDTTGGQTWRSEFQKMIAPGPNQMTYAAAIQKFMSEHGDASTSYTIAKTASTTGVTAPATQPALDFLTNNEALLTGPHGLGASFLTPQSGAPGDGQLVFNQLLKDGLRERRTPQQYMDAIYTAEGDRQFFAAYDVHKTLVAALSPGSAALNNENAAWKAWFTTQQQAHPIWAENFDPLKRQLRAHQAVTDLQTIIKDGSAPQGEQTTLVAGLLDDYQAHAQNLAAISQGQSGSTATQEKTAWHAYLDSEAAADPRLGNVIRTVFKRL